MINWLELLITTCQVILASVRVAWVEAASGSFDSSERHTVDLLELVHSDVCGKISETSMGGVQYFLTFTDDKSRYSILKTKDQVFD